MFFIFSIFTLAVIVQPMNFQHMRHNHEYQLTEVRNVGSLYFIICDPFLR